MQYTVITYQTEEGHIPFEEYITSLEDRKAKLHIARRIQRAEAGNLGDHHSLNEGLHEMRIDYGAGYRIYFTYHGRTLIILLLAGDKRTQDTDIRTARKYLLDFKRRNI